MAEFTYTVVHRCPETWRGRHYEFFEDLPANFELGEYGSSRWTCQAEIIKLPRIGKIFLPVETDGLERSIFRFTRDFNRDIEIPTFLRRYVERQYRNKQSEELPLEDVESFFSGKIFPDQLYANDLTPDEIDDNQPGERSKRSLFASFTQPVETATEAVDHTIGWLFRNNDNHSSDDSRDRASAHRNSRNRQNRPPPHPRPTHSATSSGSRTTPSRDRSPINRGSHFTRSTSSTQRHKVRKPSPPRHRESGRHGSGAATKPKPSVATTTKPSTAETTAPTTTTATKPKPSAATTTKPATVATTAPTTVTPTKPTTVETTTPATTAAAGTKPATAETDTPVTATTTKSTTATTTTATSSTPSTTATTTTTTTPETDVTTADKSPARSDVSESSVDNEGVVSRSATIDDGNIGSGTVMHRAGGIETGSETTQPSASGNVTVSEGERDPDSEMAELPRAGGLLDTKYVDIFSDRHFIYFDRKARSRNLRYYGIKDHSCHIFKRSYGSKLPKFVYYIYIDKNMIFYSIYDLVDYLNKALKRAKIRDCFMFTINKSKCISLQMVERRLEHAFNWSVTSPNNYSVLSLYNCFGWNLSPLNELLEMKTDERDGMNLTEQKPLIGRYDPNLQMHVFYLTADFIESELVEGMFLPILSICQHQRQDTDDEMVWSTACYPKRVSFQGRTLQRLRFVFGNSNPMEGFAIQVGEVFLIRLHFRQVE
jgi:hypothetical protein